MKPILIQFFSVLLLFSLLSCQKEFSFETDNTPAEGSLQSDFTDECLPKTVVGAFVAGAALTDSNYVQVQVNITKAGSYLINTDTINGYSFQAVGNFTATGINQVILKGRGTPLTQGTNLFLISFDSTICYVQVAVLPPGAGGPADFTLEGSGGDCLDAIVLGNYVKNTLLNSSNKVDIKVNVATIGTYNIVTPATNGMVFSASGTFATAGVQTVTLSGSGAPVNEGATTISVTAGSSSCTFVVVTTVGTPPPTGDYFPRTTNSNWSYEYNDDPADTILQVVIPQTQTALGNTFNIFMFTNDAAAGFDTAGYFRKSGGDYFQFLDFGSYLGVDSNTQWVEYNFLKDDQAVGFSWYSNPFSVTEQGLTFTLRIKLTILQKDVTVSVKGAAYANTIVLEEKYEQLILGSWEDATPLVGYFKNYYSRGVGLIKWEYFDGVGTLFNKYELKRYQVF